MSYTSPNYSYKTSPHFRYSDGFKPPYISPPNNGQAFSPYSYSSPKQSNRGGRMRYFNSSSPYKHNRNNRDTYHKNNRRSNEYSIPASAYYHPSMLENPWEELEKEWQEKKESELTSKNSEPSGDTSPK
ncbi:unnamed protein product [Nezara viridula]|uniref:Uncharacterized protein n=1 Tax=Nezara viridula TaxID=85310 RepID=A0A9P0HPZ6_NEZVI|nr:unnamed protein product [Nezara viridula]